MSLIKLSHKQIDAARRNGAKSHGPQTLGGKARSSMNALQHGRHAKLACILRGENKEGFQSLLQSLVRRFPPVDEAELSLVRNLASIGWRLARIIAAESRIFDIEVDIQTTALENAGSQPSELDASRESQFIFQRQSVFQQLRQLRGDWPLPSPPPQIIESEPIDPEIPARNEPEANPQPIVSIDEPPPLGSSENPASEAA